MAREMKGSGIEWIGEIPKEWEIGRIGQLYTERKEKVSDKDYAPLSVTMKGIVPQLSTAAKTDAHDDRKLVIKGDFAINSRSDRRGSCGISKYDGSVSLINIILSPKNEMNPIYYEWLFHSTMFSDEFYKWGHGIVNDLWTTNWQDMKKITVPIPSKEEQEQIANFLDTQCAHIDSVIEKTRAAIEEYKKLKQAVITQAVTKGIRPNREMKDSGIEWIGEIPKEWEINSVSQLFSQVNNKNTDLQETNLLSLSYGKIIRKNIETTDGLLPESFDGYNIIEAKDIVLRLTDLQNDHKSLRVGLVTERGIITSAYLTIRNHSTSLAKYIYYYLYAFDISKGFYGMGAGVRQGLNWDGVKWLKILSPSVAEQQIIVDFLDNKCNQIDALIQKKKQLISELEAYKKSLIYEYVTGKKEVPDNKTISISVEFQIALLMCKILKTTGIKGRTHLQKVIYALDTLLDLFPDTQYYRYPHGPYDLYIEKYESILVNQGWIKITKTDGRIRYNKTDRFNEFEKLDLEVFKTYNTEIQKICSLFIVGQTSKAEKMATLLASWNDFLIDGVVPTDDMIINDIVTNWTVNKANIPEETWREELRQLKEKQLVPKGYGKHTLKKEQNDYAH